MKVISIKLKRHIVPGGSCSTGYSECDKFDVTFDNGKRKPLFVDIWYIPIDCIGKQFVDAFIDAFGLSCNNIEEAYIMYLDEIATKSCPWTKEQILKEHKVSQVVYKNTKKVK